MKYTYTEKELIAAVKSSKSIRQAIIKLGLVAAGAAYRSFHKAIKQYNVDTSHFTGQGWTKGKKLPARRHIEEYLSNRVSTTSHFLRKRLISEGYKRHKCEMCGLKEWLGDPIPLELDHIDGNHDNNALENLRILCPNCHAKTPTYRGRKKKLKTKKESNKCNVCEKIINPTSKHCKSCSPRKTKIAWPSDENLAKMVWETPRSILAKQLGVSDKAIAKRCEKRNIPQPSRGHWTKIKNKLIDRT